MNADNDLTFEKLAYPEEDEGNESLGILDMPASHIPLHDADTEPLWQKVVGRINTVMEDVPRLYELLQEEKTYRYSIPESATVFSKNGLLSIVTITSQAIPRKSKTFNHAIVVLANGLCLVKVHQNKELEFSIEATPRSLQCEVLPTQLREFLKDTTISFREILAGLQKLEEKIVSVRRKLRQALDEANSLFPSPASADDPEDIQTFVSRGHGRPLQ